MTFNDTIKNLETYEAGKPIELVVRDFGIKAEDVIKLASNENPYGTSPKVVKKISTLVKNMYLYPDDSMFELKESLAKKFEVKKNNIIIGSGSDQIIEFCIHAKSNKNSKILMAKTTFAMYEIYGKHVGAEIIKTKNEMHNLEEFIELYKLEKPNIIFLCIPNNPLGECLDTNEIYNFLNKINSDTMVVIDGAYQEFAAYKDKNKKIIPSELIKKYPNCIYLGTFSKAYGLGGARVGYGIGSKEIIDALSKLRAPFNITTLSLAAATEALKDEEFIKNYLEKNLLEMKKYENFAKEKKLDFIDSYTNFITIKMGDKYNSKEISNKLLKEGIIVRDLTNYKQNAIRITIGTSEQNEKVLKILNKII